MKYNPLLTGIAILSAVSSSYFIATVLFADTTAKIVSVINGDGAVILWIALLLVLAITAIYIRSNGATVQKVLAGEANWKEMLESWIGSEFIRKKSDRDQPK